MSIFLIGTLFFGEYLDFYNTVDNWDNLMHAGFSAYLTYQISNFLDKKLYHGDKPHDYFHFMHALGIAVTLGVFWEFFEYGVDVTFGMNMQKSGLPDTMYDLAVDTIGAVVGVIAFNFRSKFQK